MITCLVRCVFAGYVPIHNTGWITRFVSKARLLLTFQIIKTERISTLKLYSDGSDEVSDMYLFIISNIWDRD